MEVVATERFIAWRRSLDAPLRAAVDALVGWLTANGDDIYQHRENTDRNRWEPRAKRIESSGHCPDLWELRDDRTVGEIHLRLLVGFTGPHRAAVLLGGDKTGNWSQWYLMAVPTADRALEHLLRGPKPRP
ncbi:MAG: hypothetical protein ACRDZ8_05255 [Acidimicrobiales bacterium]